MKLSTTEIITIGLMMFSIYFGAGNLIFPPALGQAAGVEVVPAMLGFLVTGVGLPLLGIAAIAMQNGNYIGFLEEKISPTFAGGLLVLLYLTIGPCFAVPRTGAVSFEIGVRPFLAESMVWEGQVVYTAVFFIATFFIAKNPSKLVDRVGKALTPMLLLFLTFLFITAFLHPLGDVMEATGTYITAPFAQGFQDGYQTMDLLASVAIGTIVVNGIRERGVDACELGSVCLKAGAIALCLMALVYGALAFIGATSRGVLGVSENGGQLLASAVGVLFGSFGNIILAVIIILACLTTSAGIASGAAWYFNKILKNRVSYERLLLFCVLFSFGVSNVGLTQIIALAVPVLVTIYPVVIVLVLISMLHSWIGNRRNVYRGAAALTLVFAIVDGLGAAGVQIPGAHELLVAYMPFYNLALGWIAPALVGAGVGFLLPSDK